MKPDDKAFQCGVCSITIHEFLSFFKFNVSNYNCSLIRAHLIFPSNSTVNERHIITTCIICNSERYLDRPRPSALS